MGRKKGTSTNKLCWHLLIKFNDDILKEQDYSTLKQIAEELGISYNRVFELTEKGRVNKLNNSKYTPTITITKIS